MERIRLRAHHIDLLNVDSLSAAVIRYYTTRAYSPEHAVAIDELRDALTPDTLVEIVEGLDDICNGGCPWIDPCEAGDSEALFNAKRDRYYEKGGTPNTFRKGEIRTDADCLEEYGLEVGETYRWRELLERVRTR